MSLPTVSRASILSAALKRAGTATCIRCAACTSASPRLKTTKRATTNERRQLGPRQSPTQRSAPARSIRGSRLSCRRRPARAKPSCWCSAICGCLKTVEHPEEILAITFTRKAAAEMKRRVLEGLPSVLAPDAIADIAPRLRVQTIDALCASLTRQMPVLARFGAQPEIVDDARELYHEAARRTLALAPANAPAEHLLAHLDNNLDTAGGLLAAMLARRDQWLRKTGRRADPRRARSGVRCRAGPAACICLRAAAGCVRRTCAGTAHQRGARRGESGTRARNSLATAMRTAACTGGLAALLALPPAAYTRCAMGGIARDARAAAARGGRAAARLRRARPGRFHRGRAGRACARSATTTRRPTSLLALD